VTQKLSRRVQAVRPSATLAFSARAVELKRQGRDVVSLSAGEPDFPVPAHVEKAIEQALQRGMTKYTASPGVQELREAIADRMEIEIGQRWGIKDIVATAGAKQALYNACQALLDEGDEAIVPCPYWVSYPDMVRLAGATAVPLECSGERGWIPRPEALEKAITSKTRAVILGSPSNPTGAVWDEETMRGFARVLEKHPQIAILSDDIYGRLVYGGAKAVSILRVAPQLRERTVVINGCSKAYAMTGLRLGWACGPSDIIAAMNRVQDSSTSNPSSLTQYAGIAALRGPQEPVEAMRQQFEKRRDLIIELLRAIPRMGCSTPQGAFYVLCDVRAYLTGRIENDVRLAEALLEEHGLATVPGSAFGAPGHLRLSFATSETEIRRGLARLAGLAAQAA
jgi:aspartate aminotransferase